MNNNEIEPEPLRSEYTSPATSERPRRAPDNPDFSRILSKPSGTEARPLLQGVVIGRLLGLVDESRVPLVALPGPAARAGLRARSIVDVYAPHVGRDVLLLFEDGDETKPIIVGLLRDDGPTASSSELGQIELTVDGERVILSAATELVLRCGKSRITLRQDGKIEVSGETILTRATGANRIQGGTVQLN
jgi:hypothetical protein